MAILDDSPPSTIVQTLMRRIQDLQEEVYQQALESGYFRTMQAQLKSYVFDLIETKCSNTRNVDFAFEHPLLSKMRRYPMTSLCLDLVQEFLQSFKFKHTLNVFKKEVNRTAAISRASLSQSFKMEIKNPESQAVLLGIVSQLSSGDIGAMRENAVRTNNFVQPPPQQQQQAVRNNYQMGEQARPQTQPQHAPQPQVQSQQPKKAPSTAPDAMSQYSQPSSSQSGSVSYEPSGSDIRPSSGTSQSQQMTGKSSYQASKSQENSVSQDSSSQPSAPSASTTKSKEQLAREAKEAEAKRKQQEKLKKEEEEKAHKLLQDVMGKAASLVKKETKEDREKKEFESRRAFSEQKAQKKVDEKESGANKIRAPSMGKGSNSLMSKFMSSFQQSKPEPEVEEELDEFQQSRDSTRRNPLFSSTESGFERSGFDYSVDSNAIEDYEYVERAKKFAKKF